MKAKRFPLIVVSAVFFLLLCGGCVDSSAEHGSQNSKDVFTYEAYQSMVEGYAKGFAPDGFVNATSEIGPTNMIVVFSQDEKLDKRSNDGVEGNPQNPSKYVLYFLNEKLSVFIKMSIIYASSNEEGILYHSITSPVDNEGIASAYHSIERPFNLTKVISRKNYMISLEYFSTASRQDSQETDADRIQTLIDTDSAFSKVLTAYILDNNL